MSWAILCSATQDRWVIVKSSDNLWSAGGVATHSTILAETPPMNSTKRQKIWHGKISPPKAGSQYATGEEQRAITNSSSKNEVAEPKRERHKLWMCLVVKVKSNAMKNNKA